MKKNYVEFKGLFFPENTPERVKSVLTTAREMRQRIRIYYGDIATGRSWNEESDIIGKVGRSTGSIKIPILLQKSNSTGGGEIMSNSIVRIDSTDGYKLYQHPTFSQSKFEAIGTTVLQDGQPFAPLCKNEKSAQRLAEFMNGKRMSK